jgi:hypothetical protein
LIGAFGEMILQGFSAKPEEKLLGAVDIGLALRAFCNRKEVLL